MNVSQTSFAQAAENIETYSLSMLVSEVEKTASGHIQLLQLQQEYYKEISQDAA